MYCIEQRSKFLHIFSVTMTPLIHQLLKTEVLDALRESLRDLENLKLVSANEPDVLLLKEHLRNKITELENEQSAETAYLEMAA